MADRIAVAMATLTEKLTAYASTEATLRRGALSCTINFTGGADMLRVSDGQGGTKIQRSDLSGTFAADEVNFGAGVVELQDGDRIDYDGNRYELTPTSNGNEPSWHYCNTQKTAVRIHAKFIEEV